jgi:hypothetical protein
MRKILIVAGLLMGAALLTGSPAKSDIGCECIKLGAAPVCTATVLDCNLKVGGVCIAPCAYTPPKMAKKHKSKKKM